MSALVIAFCTIGSRVCAFHTWMASTRVSRKPCGHTVWSTPPSSESTKVLESFNPWIPKLKLLAQQVGLFNMCPKAPCSNWYLDILVSWRNTFMNSVLHGDTQLSLISPSGR